MPAIFSHRLWLASLLVGLQPLLTAGLAGPLLGERLTTPGTLATQNFSR